MFGDSKSTFGKGHNFTEEMESRGVPRNPIGIFTQKFNLISKVERLFNCSGLCGQDIDRQVADSYKCSVNSSTGAI